MVDNKISVLEELRKKAEQKNSAVSLQDEENKKLEQIYREELLPKMQYLFDNLKETVDHLNFLEEPIVVPNYSSKYPQFGKLHQKSYRINTDGRGGHANYNDLRQINVNFFCEGQGDFTYVIESKFAAENEVEFLHNRKLDFTEKKQHNGARTVFTIKRKVPVSFHIAVNFNQSKFIVVIDNHENLNSFNKNYLPSELNDEFLNSLLSYFIRKDSLFIKQEPVANEREIIKIALQQKQQALLLEEMNRKNKSSKIGSALKSLFSKDSK